VTATIHIVRWDDPDRYQALLYDLPAVPRELRTFDGRAKRGTWETPPVYVDGPRLEAPDFWRLVGSATIVVSPQLAQELGGFLHPVGELLPLRLSGTGETLLALNILRDVDCLDPAADDLDNLNVLTQFLVHRLDESGLFKIPQVDDVEIFYLERTDDAETLRQTIETRGLRGIHFVPVWSSDGSIEPVNLLSTF
jgi:hypothetical protein